MGRKQEDLFEDKKSEKRVSHIEKFLSEINFSSFAVPDNDNLGFTIYPNLYWDKIAPILSDAEHRVMGYLFRRTFGFAKQSDKVSLTQLSNGIKKADGTQFDFGCGLKHRTTIIKALRVLHKVGLITKTLDKNGNNWYTVNITNGIEKILPLHKVEIPEAEQTAEQTKKNISHKQQEPKQQKNDDDLVRLAHYPSAFSALPLVRLAHYPSAFGALPLVRLAHPQNKVQNKDIQNKVQNKDIQNNTSVNTDVLANNKAYIEDSNNNLFIEAYDQAVHTHKADHVQAYNDDMSVRDQAVHNKPLNNNPFIEEAYDHDQAGYDQDQETNVIIKKNKQKRPGNVNIAKADATHRHENIFAVWKDKTLTEIETAGDVNKLVSKRVNQYTDDNIISAINNYASVVAKNLWTGKPLSLTEFLTTKNLVKFLPGKFDIANFTLKRKISSSTVVDYENAYRVYVCWNAKKQESDDIIICTESFNGIKHRLKGAINKRNPDDICVAIDNYVSAIKAGYKARYALIEFLYKIDKFMPQNFKASNFSYNGNKPYSNQDVASRQTVVRRQDIPYDKIVGYMNKTAGKQFSVDNNTCLLIDALWKKGYRESDFVRVIDNMTAKWKMDQKMNMFLRPQTLFNIDKFENYLNSASVKAEEKYTRGTVVGDERYVRERVATARGGNEL